MDSVNQKKSTSDMEKATSVTSNSVGEIIPVVILEHANADDGDLALKVLANVDEHIVLDEKANRAFLRKIDFHLMPLLSIVYGLNYLDKTTMSYASVMGFKSALNLQGQQYSWLSSLFYFGYLVFELPSGRLLQRLPLAKYSAVMIILWGGTLCCMAACHSFAGAAVVRFFLGVFESAVTPGFTLMTSQWYKKEEQGTRTAIWSSFNGMGQIIGGVLAYGVSVGLSDNTTIPSWKVIFLIIGLFTMAIGVLFLFVMPDNQMNAWFLSPQEKIMALERIRDNQQGVGNKHFKMYQLKEALTDPFTWAIVLFALAGDIPNGGLSNFFAQLIVAFGFTENQSLLYAAPGGAVQIASLLLSGWLGDIFNARSLVASGGLLIGALGQLLIAALPTTNKHGRLAGFYLTQAGSTGFMMILSLISSNTAGYTKKTTVAALYLVFYCVGNIIGPQVYLEKDAPQYLPALEAGVVLWVFCAFDLWFIWWWFRRQNKKKAAIRTMPGYATVKDQEFLDLTDRENPEFVYRL